MSFKINEQDQNNLNKLSTLIKLLNNSGHNPATSGNYSLRSTANKNFAFLSESGIDKSQFSEENFIALDIHSKLPIDSSNSKKSSDETDVHLAILKATDAECVLHSHMLEVLHFADLFKGKAFADLKNLELLKGFKGVKTHDINIQIPIFDNTQDIKTLAENIGPILSIDPNCYGVILAGHGIYVWGESIEGAKRHLEVFKYIFNYYINKR